MRLVSNKLLGVVPRHGGTGGAGKLKGSPGEHDRLAAAMAGDTIEPDAACWYDATKQSGSALGTR